MAVSFITLNTSGQFNCWRKPKYPDKTTDLLQVIDKQHFSHLQFITLNRRPLYYLNSMLVIKVGCTHASIQVVTHLFKSFDGWQYFCFVLKIQNNFILCINIHVCIIHFTFTDFKDLVVEEITL